MQVLLKYLYFLIPHHLMLCTCGLSNIEILCTQSSSMLPDCVLLIILFHFSRMLFTISCCLIL